MIPHNLDDILTQYDNFIRSTAAQLAQAELDRQTIQQMKSELVEVMSDNKAMSAKISKLLKDIEDKDHLITKARDIELELLNRIENDVNFKAVVVSQKHEVNNTLRSSCTRKFQTCIFLRLRSLLRTKRCSKEI
jgi:hypothetical protein